MTTIKQLALTLILICLPPSFLSAQAQTPRMTTVNISTQSDKVHITAEGDVAELRIDVADASGDVVFQSGAISGHAVDWNMRDVQGERVAAGTYLVTVTYRTSNGKLRKRVEQVVVEEAEKASTPTPSASTASVPVQTTGTVTAGRIPKFASIGANVAAVTNSVITESAGRIGIGTAAPIAPLTVVGNWNGQDGALRLNGDKPTIRFAGTEVSGNQSWLIHQGSNGPGNLEFHRKVGTKWGQVMSLTPAGNVGIGTPNPTGNLHVQSSAGFTSLKLTAGPGAGANAGSWRVQADDGLSGQGAAFVIYSDTAQQYRMIIDGRGNVTIGTTEPSFIDKLHVEGGNLTGVYGNSHQNGVWGESDIRVGVRGESNSGRGVFGYSDSGTGVWGATSSGYAGYFEGDVHVTGTINPSSDRAAKADFQLVNSREILRRLANLPVQTWTYRSDHFGARHLGPTAQDFAAAFHLGRDDKSIATVDADGVTMAAIQGLYQMMQEKDKKNEQLVSEVQQLRAQLLQQQTQLNQVKRTIKRKRSARK